MVCVDQCGWVDGEKWLCRGKQRISWLRWALAAVPVKVLVVLSAELSVEAPVKVLVEMRVEMHLSVSAEVNLPPEVSLLSS